MLDPTLYQIKIQQLDANDRFVAKNGVDDRLTCLDYQHGKLAKAAAGKDKRDSDSETDADIMSIEEVSKIKKDPMTDYVENVFKKFQD